jgi:hypothetical protein
MSDPGTIDGISTAGMDPAQIHALEIAQAQADAAVESQAIASSLKEHADSLTNASQAAAAAFDRLR